MRRIPMPNPLTFDNLTPGDILLYRAEDGLDNWLSAIIRKLDGTEVSHAALYLGNATVAEALAVGPHQGLATEPLTTSIAGSQWVAVHRLRL
jgi:cell wall-associated NlpC family hydrolase